jgi:hypothetical protein
MDILSDSDNDSVLSVDSDNLDDVLKEKKKSKSLLNKNTTSNKKITSNKNIKTTYRLGRLVNNDEIYADGFTMKWEQSDKQFKFVMHVTFSKNDKPICISVIKQGIQGDERTDQWIWCNEKDINKKGNYHTIITKQDEVLRLGKRVKQEDMRDPNAKARNAAIYKDINDFDVQGNAYYITSDDINVGIPFKMYKTFNNRDNINQVLGLTVVQNPKKPKGMQGLDAYINDIVLKKRILTKIKKASEFEEEIKQQRQILKNRVYPLKS